MSQPPINRLSSVMTLLNMHHMLRLFWSLQLDGRVSPMLKIQSWCGLVYFLSPLDVIPDYITGVGLLDDIIMALILLQSFIELAPRQVVVETCLRLNIDLKKVFVSVPSTVQDAMEIYNWASQRFSSFASSPDGPGARPQSAYSRRDEESAPRPRQAEGPAGNDDDDDEVNWPEPSPPRRYERYSAFRNEDS